MENCMNRKENKSLENRVFINMVQFNSLENFIKYNI